MNVKVTNLLTQPISLSNGVQLAAADTKGSTREVAETPRIRKLGEKGLILVRPEEPAAAVPKLEAPAATAADEPQADAASVQKRSKA